MKFKIRENEEQLKQEIIKLLATIDAELVSLSTTLFIEKTKNKFFDKNLLEKSDDTFRKILTDMQTLENKMTILLSTFNFDEKFCAECIEYFKTIKEDFLELENERIEENDHKFDNSIKKAKDKMNIIIKKYNNKLDKINTDIKNFKVFINY